MGSKQGYLQPQLGATFVPGGVDDFYLPEVISPSPQRVMPEVPEHMQENIAYLELEANSSYRLSGLQSPVSLDGPQHFRTPSYPNRGSSLVNSSGDQSQSYSTGNSLSATSQREHGYSTHANQALSPPDLPSFSPFPPILNRQANVPPSNEEREAMLESARTQVLNSNDPEMQLSWAHDALVYVEIAASSEIRISENQAPRSQTPRIEHQLRENAISIVSFLAEQHHPKAEFMKGMWLEFGKFGSRMDRRESFACYSRAAQNGYARAQYRMGMQFENSNNAATAIKHYKLGVEAGDSASHYRLGMMTLLGQLGQVQNYKRAVQLIQFAAETADENAPQGAYVFGMLLARDLPQINLPEIYLPSDFNAARSYIEKAAYLGFAKAQAKMGAAYELCQLGCDFDPALSLHYNALAARQDDSEADMAISKWFLCGYEGIFEKKEELAFTYAQRAAQLGLGTAEFAMGYFYEIGMYVPVDLKVAKSWYGKAFEHGNQDAAARLDGISRSRTLSKKDHENIAVAKIKSQYGSHRNKRPERFSRNPTATMPTISDDMDEDPDPFQLKPLPIPRENRPVSSLSTHTLPQRPASAAPYPIEAQRPASTTPYPVDDGLTVQSKPVKTSSFIHPDIRPSTAGPMGGPPRNEYYRGPSPAANGATRPYSSMDAAGVGRGRGTPLQPQFGVGAMGVGRGRGIQAQRFASDGSVPQADRQPVGSRSDPPQPTLIDIGYTAPLDPLGADRKKRLQKSDNPGLGVSRPSTGGEKPPDRVTSTLGTLPPQILSGRGHTSSPSRQSVRPDSAGRPSNRQDPMPIGPGSRPSSDASTPNLPPTGAVSNLTTPAVSTGAAPAKMPGKGPQTFEEMGVPHGKKDGDCVMM